MTGFVFTLCIAAPLTGNAYTLHTTSSGFPVRWAERSLSVYVDPSVEAIDRNAVSIVARSFAAWTSVAGAAPPVVLVSRGAATEVSDGGSGLRINTVRYAPEGFAPAGNALAITVLTYDSDGAILHADIVVNGAPNRCFKELPDPPPRDPNRDNVFDLEDVITHEAGHFFGLAHNNADPGAVMYFETLPDTTSKRTLTEDDEQGLRGLYPEGAVASGCHQGQATPRAASGWPALALVVVAPVLRGRKRRLRRRLV